PARALRTDGAQGVRGAEAVALREPRYGADARVTPARSLYVGLPDRESSEPTPAGLGHDPIFFDCLTCKYAERSGRRCRQPAARGAASDPSGRDGAPVFRYFGTSRAS